ncbi:MAG: thioredoxin family protein [Salibacteraceae bacterium]
MKALLHISLVIIALTFVQGTPINAPSSDAGKGITFFEGTWEEALEMAEKEDKMIFLDAYAVWCGPCKLLKKNVFTDEGVGNFYNKNFINFEMDMERGIGPKMAQQFRVTAYPTLLFVKADGSVANKAVGYHPQAQLIALGEKVLNAQNEE